MAQDERRITDVFARLGLSADPALVDLGLAADKGLAIFWAGRDVIAILPVADRERFVMRTGATPTPDGDRIADATCKPVDGVGYTCSTSAALVARLGTGHKLAALAAREPVRGDLEVVLTQPASLTATVQLARGAAVARVTITGLPPQLLGPLGAPITPQIDLDHTAGFAVANITPLLRDLPTVSVLPDLTIADLGRAVAGRIAVSIPTGELAFDARIPLLDPAPVQHVLDHCDQVKELGMVGARPSSGACRATVRELGVTFEAAIRDGELHVATTGVLPTSSPVPASAVARELATNGWSFVFWGRGTTLSHVPIAALPPLSGDVAAVVRLLGMVDEVGAGVRVDGDRVRALLAIRTAWANPDDVVSQIVAVPADEVVAGHGGAHGEAIARAAPGSPFAGDFRAGIVGLAAPAAAIGLLGSVFVPAYVDYVRHSDRR
jgi:hypothetical protein